jgi:hypothetical protein
MCRDPKKTKKFHFHTPNVMQDFARRGPGIKGWHLDPLNWRVAD